MPDPSLIPYGEYCYSIEPIADGELLNADISRFGRKLREYRYHKGFKQVLCPYWQRTDYGTVRCNFLDSEVVDDEDPKAKEKLAAHFGKPITELRLAYSWALSDEIKICGVGTEEDEQ